MSDKAWELLIGLFLMAMFLVFALIPEYVKDRIRFRRWRRTKIALLKVFCYACALGSFTLGFYIVITIWD